MHPRFRASALAGAALLALTALAASGCGALPTQPVVDSRGVTTARMIETVGEPADDSTPALTPVGVTPTPTVDRPGNSQRPPKKPKKNH